MYQRDVALIKDHAMKSPDGLVDVVLFVLLTIQAGLSTVKAQRKDVAQEGLASRFLWGKKGDGLAYVEKHKEYLWVKAQHIAQSGMSDPDNVAEAVMLFINVPNLGMVKASFVCQMLGFDVSCIDSHNLTRLDMKASAVKVSNDMKPLAKHAKVKAYVEMTQATGGTEYWWNTWCEYVADNSANKALDTGDVVSAYHVACVID